MAFPKLTVLALLVALTACSAKPPPAAPPAPAKLTISEIARRANPSIVSILTEESQGTGFVVDGKGAIATNRHVIEGAREIEVVLANGEHLAASSVTLADGDLDLAIVHVESRSLKPLALGGEAVVGEHVVAIGNPIGLDRTVSDGLVSSIREEEGATFLQISAPISHGSSGGPAFNDLGEVIGVTTASHVEAQNINWALPVASLKAFLASGAKPLAVEAFGKANARAENEGWVKAQLDKCAQGASEACVTLGDEYTQGKHLARDYGKAADLYRRACELGSVVGCTDLGISYHDGHGRSRDRKRALDLFEKACAHDHAEACAWAGKVNTEIEGAGKRSKTAIKYYQKACDAGSRWSCQEAATIYERGKKLDRALVFYQRACDGNLLSSCTKLGVLLRDEGRSIAIFRRACEGGDVEGCGHLGKALVEGRGVSANVSQGIDYLRWSCRQGSSFSCEKLRALGAKS